MLRHRDRHVRKHVIALLARDATGEDAQALSATLIALTTAPDIQTVRQALLALGHARAHWASSAISACLDHPNMNIRKTAAEALVRAGTPAALPKLLFRLGHEENLALRDRISEALHAVLGDAYAATIVAAAEHSRDDSTRELLLKRLHGTLTARSVLALHDQESPVALTLLSLVASRRIGLASGTMQDLATAMAGHGITAPAAEQPSSVADEADRDIRVLVAGAGTRRSRCASPNGTRRSATAGRHSSGRCWPTGSGSPAPVRDPGARPCGTRWCGSRCGSAPSPGTTRSSRRSPGPPRSCWTRSPTPGTGTGTT
ncbi:HEAT repeat domain-containing protein [Streptomyces sanglieri]|uniref:HEAT repeat domain-containing protein n=1 Tax=Streptomyces sanglieri TaxID=193460 RepID=A0ABW2X2J9_9ACTN